MALLVCVVACSKPAATSGTTGSAGSGSAAITTATADASAPVKADDPCSATALGLPGGKQLVPWEPPADCTLTGITTPGVFRSETSLRKLMVCKDPKIALGIDFATNVVIVKSMSWSPAQVGLSALDDGKTVLFASHQRNTCPDDPQPMPTALRTSVFLAAPGERTFTDRGCTVPRVCP